MSRSLRVAPEYFAQVKLAIKRSGFPSQQALATELGFVRSTVSNFVNGKPVDFITFVEICGKLALEWQAIVDTKQTDKETSMPESKLQQKYPNLPVAVILTAIPEETEAVLYHLQDVEKVECYSFGYFEGDVQSWLVAVREIGQGNYRAINKAKETLTFWKPKVKVALFIGVAGGIKDVSLGDVVVGNIVRCYEQGKVVDGYYLDRTQPPSPPSPKLIADFTATSKLRGCLKS